MKRLVLIFVFVLFSSALFAQETIDDKQFMLGCANVGSTEEVTHYIDAVGEVWQRESSGSFVTGGIYNNSLVTEGNADFGPQSPQSPQNWPGFNFSWDDDDFYPFWSLGFYKVTNSKQTDNYFYLDSRDSRFGAVVDYSPDFWIYFDNNSFGSYWHHPFR